MKFNGDYCNYNNMFCKDVPELIEKELHNDAIECDGNCTTCAHQEEV